MHQSTLTYDDGIYRLETSPSDRLLEKITFFLISDVGCRSIELIKRDLYDSNYPIIHYNMHRLDIKNDIVLMSDDYIADDDERLFYSTEIKLDELARVLDQWKEICKIMPPYVVITRDGEKITLQGYESLEEMNTVN